MHLTEEATAALAAGDIDPAGRAGALAHMAECAECRRAVASVARALSSRDIGGEIRALEQPRFRPGRVAAGLAAAAIVVWLVAPPRLSDPVPQHRAPPITAAPGPEALAPAGTVARVSDFAWTPVAGADRYRLTLFDDSGATRYEIETTLTAVTLPDSVALVPGRTYGWRVVARVGFDRWATSRLTEFLVAPPRP